MVPVNGGIIGGILKLVGEILLLVFKYLSVAILYAIVGVVLYAVWDFNPFSGDVYSILYIVGFCLSVILSFLIAFRNKKGKKKNKDKHEWSFKRASKEEAEEIPLSWWEQRKEKKALKLARQQEEKERREREAREEEIREHERRLEELKAERLKEEIRREERLIDEYRHEAAVSALNRYEEVVSAHPIPREKEENPYYNTPVYPKAEPQTPKTSNYYGSYQEPKEVDGGRGYSEPKESTIQKEEPKIYMSAVEPNTLIHEYSNRFEVYHLEAGEKELVSVEYKDAK